MSDLAASQEDTKDSVWSLPASLPAHVPLGQGADWRLLLLACFRNHSPQILDLSEPQVPFSAPPSPSPRGRSPLRQREGPGTASHLAFSGESAGTFSGTSPWGCQHSGIRKGKVGPPPSPNTKPQFSLLNPFSGHPRNPRGRAVVASSTTRTLWSMLYMNKI